MALTVKSGNNQNKNIKKGSKGKYFKGRCNHCGKFGHKKADCWDLKNKKEKHQENEKKVQKDKSKVRCFKCGKLGHYANECKNDKESSGDGNNETFAITCYEDAEDDKNENGDGETNLESKNSEADERNVGPGTPRNTEEPQGTPPTQSYVFTTQVTNEWAMSTIEDNSATPRDPSSIRAWMESSKYGKYEKSRNMINVPLAREKSTLEHRSNNVPRTVENGARAQPSVSHEEDEIRNSNFEHVPSNRPSEDPEDDDRKPAAKRIKKKPVDDAQSVTQNEPKVETIVKPWENKKDYEAIFRKYIYIGNDGEEHYDVIDMTTSERIKNDSEEEVTSQTEGTDDDASETNNANVNNYLDSANMAMNLETAMKIAEEEDLWIGDSGASSHMMGSEEHVFNKKLITGSVRTANGAHMKMLCEGDINVDVITKNGDVTRCSRRSIISFPLTRAPVLVPGRRRVCLPSMHAAHLGSTQLDVLE